jgi:hypothetical protein
MSLGFEPQAGEWVAARCKFHSKNRELAGTKLDLIPSVLPFHLDFIWLCQLLKREFSALTPNKCSAPFSDG